MISRRRFIQSSAVSSLAWSIRPSMLLNFDMDLPEGFTEIRNNIGYFEGRGGTMGWMLRTDGIVVIDSQFPQQAENFMDGMSSMSERTIDTLINTHHHGDHTSGNIAFKEVLQQIVAHDNSLKNQKKSAQNRGTEDAQAYPNETFSSKWTKRFDDEIVTASYHGPAHTDGDIIIHFENANVAHMGDLVFNRKYPYIDKSAGASIENWIEVLTDALDYFDQETKFIFGHSANGHNITGTKEDILAFQNYLSQLMKYMEVQFRSGKELETILKETDHIPGAKEWKGEGIERSLNAAFMEFNS